MLSRKYLEIYFFEKLSRSAIQIDSVQIQDSYKCLQVITVFDSLIHLVMGLFLLDIPSFHSKQLIFLEMFLLYFIPLDIAQN